MKDRFSYFSPVYRDAKFIYAEEREKRREMGRVAKVREVGDKVGTSGAG